MSIVHNNCMSNLPTLTNCTLFKNGELKRRQQEEMDQDPKKTKQEKKTIIEFEPLGKFYSIAHLVTRICFQSSDPTIMGSLWFDHRSGHGIFVYHFIHFMSLNASKVICLFAC